MKTKLASILTYLKKDFTLCSKIEQPESLFKLVKKTYFSIKSKIEKKIYLTILKLRYGFKKRDFYNFDTDIFEKFKILRCRKPDKLEKQS